MVPSVETTSRWMLVTAIASIAWGSNYYVTRHALPADYPFYGALARALRPAYSCWPCARGFPRGAWWWRSALLGAMNVSAFFALIYLSAQLLPTSIAAMVMATSPIAMLLLAWLLVAERPRVPAAAGALLGIAGVAVMLTDGSRRDRPTRRGRLDRGDELSALGYLLSKRWGSDVDVLSAHGLAARRRRRPAGARRGGGSKARRPAVDGTAALGYLYVSLIATALAFAAWFAGLRHLEAGTVGLIGLLNPVTGVLLGTLDRERDAGRSSARRDRARVRRHRARHPAPPLWSARCRPCVP